MREREVEAYLRKRVEQAGGMCLKFVPDQAPGMPDRVVLLPGGTVIWVELKRPEGGRVAPLQAWRHEQLRRIGQRVEVVWTREQADELVGSWAIMADGVK
jgi:hypothetical protein